MSECAYCGCDLPGIERTCRDCYAARYAATGTAKGLSWKANPQTVATPKITVSNNRSSPQAALTQEEDRAMYPKPFLWGTILVAAGLVVYALLLYLPPIICLPVLLLAYAAIGYDLCDRSKRRARAITQCWMIQVPGGIVLILWKLTGDMIWMRLGVVAGCLLAGYIWIDRRRIV